MFTDAATIDSEEPQVEIVNKPFHFDLVGLAQGLNKTVSAAANVEKLKKHVLDAKKTLLTHQSHVAEIEKLMSQAEGDQKKELEVVLVQAKKHVSELEKTVEKAQKHLDKQFDKLNKEDAIEISQKQEKQKE